MSIITKILPLKFLTRILGFLAKINFPKVLLVPLLKAFCKKYKVSEDEMLLSLREYKNFQAFFTRPLKPEVRSFDTSSSSIISPVDGMIYDIGKIENNKLIQVKGYYHSLSGLVGQTVSKNFTNGHYIAIYLSPGDCHRIYSPVDGEAILAKHFFGKFFPVNQRSRQKVKELLCKNERILTLLENSKSMIGILKVAALFVGSVNLDYLPPSEYEVFNRKIRERKKNHEYSQEFSKGISLEKGQYMAHFKMGSTVVLLFPKDKIKITKSTNEKIHLGQKIATWL